MFTPAIKLLNSTARELLVLCFVALDSIFRDSWIPSGKQLEGAAIILIGLAILILLTYLLSFKEILIYTVGVLFLFALRQTNASLMPYDTVVVCLALLSFMALSKRSSRLSTVSFTGSVPPYADRNPLKQ